MPDLPLLARSQERPVGVIRSPAPSRRLRNGTVLIDFQAGLNGTISLTTGRLEVVHDNWVRSPGASQVTVDGNLAYWCFGVNSQYLGIGDLQTAISGLTLTRSRQTQGLSDSRGGAISYRNTFPNDSHLTVKDCVIQNSVNGGIYAEGRLSVINSQIVNNTGEGVRGGQPYVSNSLVADNSNEGLTPFDALVLVNSTFSNNGAGNNGDGVYMSGDGATMTNCTFTGNRGRGFVINYQDTALPTNCTLVGNVGADLVSFGGNAGSPWAGDHPGRPGNAKSGRNHHEWQVPGRLSI